MREMIEIAETSGSLEQEWQCGCYIGNFEVYGTHDETPDICEMRDQVVAQMMGWA